MSVENWNAALDPANIYSVRHIYRYWRASEFIRGERILDVGCGWGYGSAILLHRGQVSGVDQRRDCIEYAHARFPAIQFSVTNVDAWESLPAQFGAVVAIEVVEHLKRPQRFVEVLKQTARSVFLSTPIVPSKHVNQFHLHDFTEQQVLGWFRDWRLVYREIQESESLLACWERA